MEKRYLAEVRDHDTVLMTKSGKTVLSASAILEVMAPMVKQNFDILDDYRKQPQLFLVKLGENIYKWFFFIMALHTTHSIKRKTHEKVRCQCNKSLIKMIDCLSQICSRNEDDSANEVFDLEHHGTDIKMYCITQQNNLASQIKNFMVLIRYSSYSICYLDMRHIDAIIRLRRYFYFLYCGMEEYCLPYKFLIEGTCIMETTLHQKEAPSEQSDLKTITFHVRIDDSPFLSDFNYHNRIEFHFKENHYMFECEIQNRSYFFLKHLVTLFTFNEVSSEHEIPFIYSNVENTKTFLLFILASFCILLKDQNNPNASVILKRLSVDRKNMFKTMYTLAAILPSEILDLLNKFHYGVQQLLKDNINFDKILTDFNTPTESMSYEIEPLFLSNFIRSEHIKAYINRLSQSLDLPCKWRYSRITDVEKSMIPHGFSLTLPYQNFRFNTRMPIKGFTRTFDIHFPSDKRLQGISIHQENSGTWICQNKKLLGEGKIIEALDLCNENMIQNKVVSDENLYLRITSSSLIIFLACIQALITQSADKHRTDIVRQLNLLHAINDRRRKFQVFNCISFWIEMFYVTTLAFFYETLLQPELSQADTLNGLKLILGELCWNNLFRFAQLVRTFDIELSSFFMNSNNQAQISVTFWNRELCMLYVATIDGNEITLSYDQSKQNPVMTNELLRNFFSLMNKILNKPYILARANSRVAFLVFFLLMATVLWRLECHNWPNEALLLEIKLWMEKFDEMVVEDFELGVEARFLMDTLRCAIQAYIDKKVPLLQIISWFHCQEFLDLEHQDFNSMIKYRVMNSIDIVPNGLGFGYEIIECNGLLSVIAKGDITNPLDRDFMNATSLKALRIITSQEHISFEKFLLTIICVIDLIRYQMQHMPRLEFIKCKTLKKLRFETFSTIRSMYQIFESRKNRIGLIDEFMHVTGMALKSDASWLSAHHLLFDSTAHLLYIDQYLQSDSRPYGKRFDIEYRYSGKGIYLIHFRTLRECALTFVFSFRQTRHGLHCYKIGFSEEPLEQDRLKLEIKKVCAKLENITSYNPAMMIVYFLLIGFMMVAHTVQTGEKLDSQMYNDFLKSLESIPEDKKPAPVILDSMLGIHRQFIENDSSITKTKYSKLYFSYCFASLQLVIKSENFSIQTVKESELIFFLLNLPANCVRVAKVNDQKVAVFLTHKKPYCCIIFEQNNDNFSASMQNYSTQLGITTSNLYVEGGQTREMRREIVNRVLDLSCFYFAEDFFEDMKFYFLLCCLSLGDPSNMNLLYYLNKIRSSVLKHMAYITNKVKAYSDQGHMPTDTLVSCFYGVYMILNNKLRENQTYLDLFYLYLNYLAHLQESIKVAYKQNTIPKVIVSSIEMQPVYMSYAYRNKVLKFSLYTEIRFKRSELVLDGIADFLQCRIYDNFQRKAIKLDLTSD
ncbi:hypothetical protein Ciccas_006520, partial [Cichlidogyrus casuarinus]